MMTYPTNDNTFTSSAWYYYLRYIARGAYFVGLPVAVLYLFFYLFVSSAHAGVVTPFHTFSTESWTAPSSALDDTFKQGAGVEFFQDGTQNFIFPEDFITPDLTAIETFITTDTFRDNKTARRCAPIFFRLGAPSCRFVVPE